VANVPYDKEITALLVIDPYNDFISEGGKVWDRLSAVAEANNCVPHMLQVLNAARKAGLRVFYALHHRYRPGDYETWKYIAPVQKAAWSHKTFEDGTWGGEIRREFEPQPGDIVALEHWCFQLLCQHRLGYAAQKAWHSQAHRHRTDSTYVCGINDSLCR
jgi:nicotinamidase-related amidase